MKVAIVGAGIAGLLPAYYLAKQGIEIDIYEEERYAGMKCSYANGGQLSVSNSEVWTNWNTVIKATKWLFNKNAPFYLGKNLDIDKIKWLIKFVQSTSKQDSNTRTIETIKLGLEARLLYKQIVEDEGIEFDYSQRGILHFYKDPEYFQHAKDMHELYESNGCEWRILNSTQVYDIDPKLEKIDGIIGGVLTSDDAMGDIHKFCVNLASVLKTKYGVNFSYDRKIESVGQLATYDQIVIAAGVGSVKLAKSAGIDLPIYPVKGYSITINADQSELPSVSLLDDQAKIVTSTLGNRFRIAGTAELSGENYDISRHRILPLLDWVKTNFPKISTETYSSWACLRPMTPTMMPIVGRIGGGQSNIVFHTGHGHLGWTISPATSLRVCETILNR
jgi:D-amino-acid dehydrogenase